MVNQKDITKSKLYCNRCGSFDLIKSDRGLVAKYIFDEPKKLHCQGCDAKLSFQKIASNRPLTPPSIDVEPDTQSDHIPSVYSKVPVSTNRWSLFAKGVLGGLVLFALMFSLLLMSPYSRPRVVNPEVYLEPIKRLNSVEIASLGDVEIVRFNQVKSKAVSIEATIIMLVVVIVFILTLLKSQNAPQINVRI
jgi:hypothetical protein